MRPAARGTGPGTATKAFFWQRCNSIGEACATILGATGAAYKLTSEDVGQRIRVIETATNEGGVAQAVSATTAAVVELSDGLAADDRRHARCAAASPHRRRGDGPPVRQDGDGEGPHLRRPRLPGHGRARRATPTAFLSGSRSERVTDKAGWATFTFAATGSGSTYVYVEAHKKGEKLQAGVSTANLFKVRVR